MKSGDILERDTLRTVLGEVQNKYEKPNDENVISILKKSKEGCVETMRVADVSRWGTIPKEVKIYDKFLPSYLPIEVIVEKIKTNDPLVTQIKSAKSDGQATGYAIRLFKENGLSVEGKDVTEAVKQIRR
jgi:hypothetical protein